MLGDVSLEKVVGEPVDVDDRALDVGCSGRLIPNESGLDLPFSIRIVSECNGRLFVAVAEDIGHPGSHRSQL